MPEKQTVPPDFPPLPWRVSDEGTIDSKVGGYVVIWPLSRRDIAEAIVTAVNAYYRNADDE